MGVVQVIEDSFEQFNERLLAQLEIEIETESDEEIESLPKVMINEAQRPKLASSLPGTASSWEYCTDLSIILGEKVNYVKRISYYTANRH
jgi:hypothetical protein